jgi:hypothetical protein
MALNSGAGAPQPVLIEYIIQNDESENNLKKNPYPNIYILPKKYTSVNEVRVREVIEAFPLAAQAGVGEYLLRFETSIAIPSTKKMMTVWQDLDGEMDAVAPSNKGKIRVKALRLPKGVANRVLPK